VWTGIATLPLATFMPAWSSHRSVIAVGLGVALVARCAPRRGVARCAHRAPAGCALTSPVAPERIGIAGSNVEFDFARLTTLQRLAQQVRATLLAAHPTLPRGAHVARNQWPRGTLFAFQDPRAFQVWYRDTTLQVIEMAEVRNHPLHPLAAIVEFEPHRTPQVAMVSPVALQHVLLAADSLRGGRDEVAGVTRGLNSWADTRRGVHGHGLTVRAGTAGAARRRSGGYPAAGAEYHPMVARTA
jgi:hypothetical protein